MPSTQRADGALNAQLCHGLTLYDDRDITIREDEAGEERYVTIGMDPAIGVLVVVYTSRRTRPRQISARGATPQEREL